MFERFPMLPAVVCSIAGLFVAAGCYSSPTKISVGSPPSTTMPTSSFVSASVAPNPVPLVPVSLVGFGCPAVQPFATNFNLVFVGSTVPLALDQVSLQFIDGTSAGGSPLLVSAADLNARFGSTTIGSGVTRSFNFQPQFGCGLSQPQSLLIVAALHDNTGAAHEVSLTSPIR